MSGGVGFIIIIPVYLAKKMYSRQEADFYLSLFCTIQVQGGNSGECPGARRLLRYTARHATTYFSQPFGEWLLWSRNKIASTAFYKPILLHSIRFEVSACAAYFSRTIWDRHLYWY